MTEDIEKIFEQESREKKRTARGVFGRASRKGNKGPVKTPVDFLSGKKKRDYKANGKVETYNMYKQLPDPDKFQSLTKEEKTQLLQSYRDKSPFTNTAIYKHLGLSTGMYYSLLKLNNQEDISMRPEVTKKTKPKDDEIISTNTLKGKFTASDLHDRLVVLAGMLKESGGSNYEVNLELVERRGEGE